MKKIVAGAIIVRDKKIYICQRPADKKPPLLWEFPGGKQEPGETLPECLKRELSEELNVKAEIGAPFMVSSFDYEFGTIELHTYFATLDGGQMPVSNEHKNTAWVCPEELPDYPFCPADIPIVNKLSKIKL